MTEERYQDLIWLWENETSSEETQEWREELTPEEEALVENWDNGFLNGLARMYYDIHKSDRQLPTQVQLDSAARESEQRNAERVQAATLNLLEEEMEV